MYSYNKPNSNGKLGKLTMHKNSSENEAAAGCWAENQAIAEANDAVISTY